jgi:hypothetical protein
MQNIIDGREEPPERDWLRDASDAFSEIIAKVGKYDEAVMALLGGRVPKSEVETRQKMSGFLSGQSAMRILFYNLGLLYVKEVSDHGKVITLAPVVPLYSRDIVDILLKAYTEAPELDDATVEEYCNHHEKLVDDLAKELLTVAKAIQATHGRLPLDALLEKSVQDRIQGTFIHRFNHARIRIVRELYVKGDKKGFMDFFFAIRKAVEGERLQREVAPLNDANWRKKPSNELPHSWTSLGGLIIEVKMAIDKNARHKVACSKGKAATDSAHRKHMLQALRQAWVYRDKKGVPPDEVWLMAITCWWGDEDVVVLQYCAGEFVGHETQEDDL